MLSMFKSSINWTICTESINYIKNINSVIPIYLNLIEGGYRILVYSGDVDGAVPYPGTVAWTSSLGLVALTLWEQWSINKTDGEQVAGYFTEYDGLLYVTVKGSGHMVPQFKPEAAFYMFQKFIQDIPFY